MNSFINFLLEANICILVFGLFYFLVLKNDNHFRFSRFYIITTALLSVIIPFLQFDNPFSNGQSESFLTSIQSVFLPVLVIGDTSAPSTVSGMSTNWVLWLLVTYITVAAILFIVFSYQLLQLYHFKRLKKNAISKNENYLLIPTDGQLPTFSFFNMLFFDNTAPLTEHERAKIIDHEVVHIKEKHSWDILLLEMVKIIFWVNPAAWWMKRNIQDIHEFLADQSILKNTNEQQYSSLLAKMTLKQLSFPLGHHFNKSITLKRIKMMKAPKTKLKTWKWASMIPILLLVITVFSCNDDVLNDVNEVMKTASQAPVPAELQSELERLQNEYPDADFVYMETAGTNEEQLKNLQNIDPNSIALIKVWKEKERIGIIVNQNGPIKDFVSKDQTFQIVEEPAIPEGGYDAFYQKLGATLKYPAQARREGVEGTVYVQFVVEKDGILSNVEVLKGLGAGTDAAAKSAIESAGNWQPAKQRGEVVKQRIVLPIAFKLGDDEKKVSDSNRPEVIEDPMQLDIKRDGFTVTGKLLNADGEPISGANIVIKGTTSGTITDKNGNFKLKTSSNNDILVFSHISYETTTVPVDKID